MNSSNNNRFDGKTYGKDVPKSSSTNQTTKIAWIAISLVLSIFVVFFIAKFSFSKSSSPSFSQAPISAVNKVANVAAATFNSAGIGSNLNPPTKVTHGPTLTKGGLPRIIYIGAEYCPYCAAERWAIVAALSRFGTFSHLGKTHSSTSDVYPGTKTFSFYKSSYKSKYISFTPIETQTNQQQGSSYAPLQTPTPTESQLFNTYDTAPYTPVQGGIPFIDIANHFLITGATYSPSVLSGKSMNQIATGITTPSSNISDNVNASANLITASVCSTTHNKPSSVCNSPIIHRTLNYLNSLPAKSTN